MNPPLFTITNIIFVIVALVPSLIAWIRLGPRVDQLEKDRDQATASRMLYRASQDAEVKVMRDCLTRLTTLQEVSERRLERLEERK